jgi:hypothetical protein
MVLDVRPPLGHYQERIQPSRVNGAPLVDSDTITLI